MREILFRGKLSGVGDRWAYGLLIEQNEVTNTILEHGWSKCLVIPESVGQFTGLYDKNNVRIFEGDIVSAKNKVGEIYRFEVKFGKCGGTENVEHDVGYIGFYFEEVSNTIPVEYMLRKDTLYWLNEYDCEVIGNIFDNTELLKEG